MCGFAVIKQDRAGSYNNNFVKLRGQDDKGSALVNGFSFEHYLLSITGDKLLQPFRSIDGTIWAVYNGEIYNHEYAKSDGENIIPLYQKYGIDFVHHLDGEYAIVLFDFKNDVAFYISDLFGTKPLYRDGLQAASYKSCLNGGIRVEANEIHVVKISTAQVLRIIKPYHDWIFGNQFKETYDDCIKAFEMAIAKRAKHGCFIGLSSGYDSGAIACELNRQNIEYKAFMIMASETPEIMCKRADKSKNVLITTNFDLQAEKQHLSNNAEEFFYNIWYDDKGFCNDSYKKDYAAAGLSYICRQAKKEDRKVYLSGTGADEILSDYSLIRNQSTFKGNFPKVLTKWRNFNDSCMYSYIGKEECVAGSWNVETRYPFLDKDFVQEFLWLSQQLKNKFYKNVLHEYLTRHNYPFQPNMKIGFTVG